jgi:hypothetical protein
MATDGFVVCSVCKTVSTFTQMASWFVLFATPSQHLYKWLRGLLCLQKCLNSYTNGFVVLFATLSQHLHIWLCGLFCLQHCLKMYTNDFMFLFATLSQHFHKWLRDLFVCNTVSTFTQRTERNLANLCHVSQPGTAIQFGLRNEKDTLFNHLSDRMINILINLTFNIYHGRSGHKYLQITGI